MIPNLFGILEGLGVENLREGAKEITGSCPMHYRRLGHEDRHASWSINRTTGLHNCFSCGWKGGMINLYTDLGHDAPEDMKATMASEGILAKVKTLRGETARKDAPEVGEWMFDRCKPVPPNLLALRSLQSLAAESYGVKWDAEKRCWVLPIRDHKGTLLGIQYRQKGNVLNLPPDIEKSTSLFGLSEVKDHDRAMLVESPLDAVRLYGLGIPAVSSYGAWVSEHQIKLLNRYFTTVVVGLDWDETGLNATQQVTRALRRVGCAAIAFDYTGLPGKDPGDVPDDEALLDAWHRTLRFRL